MPRNLLSSSANPPDESQTEDEPEKDRQGESDDEKDSSEKTTSQVRVLDYGSDADSGSTFPSPTASAFVVKQYSKPEVKSKKPAAVADKSEVKKTKKRGNGAIAEDLVAKQEKAKKSTGRLWCPDDELIILKGMIDYKQETGVDPSSNFDAFHTYIKGSLNAVADKSQLSSKIRKLKEKYQANAQKEANGEASLSFKGHEAKAYEHSKKIWGHDAISRGFQATKIKPKSKKEVNGVPCTPIAETDSVLALPVPEVEVSSKEVIGRSAKVSSRVPKVARKMDLDEAAYHEMKVSTIYMPVMLDNFVIEKGLELVERSKLDALNEKWTKYQLDAAELYLKRLDLVHEQTRLVLDALKSNS